MSFVTKIIGKWTYLSSEDFDEYLKEVGVGFLTRKVANNVKPELTFSIAGDEWTMLSASAFKNYTVKFKLGVPLDHDTADGRPVTSVFTIENDKLIQAEKGKNGGKDSTIIRYIEGEQLVIECKCGNVSSVRKYVK